MEVVGWGFSSICLGEEDCIVDAGEHVIALYTPIFKDASVADVIVHLGVDVYQEDLDSDLLIGGA